MSRDEANRKLADWVGFKESTMFGPGYCQAPELGYFGGRLWPDFYVDEAANALLLDKMPYPRLFLNADSPWWYCTADQYKLPAETHADRKTVVCEAALRFIK